MIEKMGSGLRFVKRAVQADLARFKAYVEMKDAKGLEYGTTDGGNDEHQERDRKQDDQAPDADQNPDGDGERSGQTHRQIRASRSSATPSTRSSTSRGKRTPAKRTAATRTRKS
jgi:hypothetical protein